jgi:hypothetical protein
MSARFSADAGRYVFSPRRPRASAPARKGRSSDCDLHRDLLTAIAGNGLELKEHDTRSERITYDLELGRSIATQPIWFLAAFEIKLILDGFLNIGRQQIVANHLSLAKENGLTPKLCGIKRQTHGTTACSR